MWVVEGKFEHLDNMAYRNVIAIHGSASFQIFHQEPRRA
jgi:hypothetical protein